MPRRRSNAVAGVVTASGRRITAGAVVITTGTFLRGEIHIGDRRVPAGRAGEAPALGLASALAPSRAAARPA